MCRLNVSDTETTLHISPIVPSKMIFKTTTYLAAAIALVQVMSAQAVWLKTGDGRVWHVDRSMVCRNASPEFNDV
ncbi:hypothetical protein BGZ65_012873, partial [Modicella reniformis]